MAKGFNLKDLLYNPPDLSELSDNTSEDSYDLHKNMHRIPSIPMPTFKKPSANQKLFSRTSPRRSAIMNGLNDYKKMFASTPMNAASMPMNAACTSSSDNSVLQLSPIPGTSKNMQVTHMSNTKQTQENGNATLLGTDKSKNGNQMNLEQSTSRHNCSKKKQNKHVNASVKAVTEHLQRLSGTLRKEEKKNQTESHSRVHTKNKKRITEKVAMIAGEKSENSLKESSNNALHRNNGNDLDGIEALNSSSEEYVTNRAKCAVTLCRYSRFHAQKTILMERQTQTTDSLEKVFKKALPTQTPLKEVKEMVKERYTIKRKIIEAEEPNKERKKPKSLIGEAKENSKKNKKNLQMELQSNATSFENEREELEGQHFERNRQKESVPFDVNVQNNSKMKFDERAFIENFLDHIDSNMKAASVISISSASEDSLKTPTNNVETTLISGKNANSEEINIAPSQGTGIFEDSLVNVADKSISNINQNQERTGDNASDEGETSNMTNNSKEVSLTKRKNQPALSSRTFSSNRKSRGDSQEINSITLSLKKKLKNTKSDSVNDCKGGNVVGGSTKSNNVKKPTKDAVKKTVEKSANQRNRSSESVETNSNSGHTTKKKGRPKGAKNRKRICCTVQPRGVKYRSTSVDAEADVLENLPGEGRPKRERRQTKPCIQTFIQPDPIRIVQPTSKTRKSSKSSIAVNEKNSRKTTSTAKNVRKRLENNNDEPIRTNINEPSTSKSVSEPNLNARKKNDSSVKSNDSKVVSPLGKNVSTLEILTRSKRNLTNDIQPATNNCVLENNDSEMTCSTSKQVLASETVNRRKKNQKNNLQMTENSNVTVTSIDFNVHCPSPKEISAPKTTNKRKKTRTNNIETEVNTRDLENINCEIDSGVVSAPTSSNHPSILVHENISIIPSLRAGSHSSKTSKGSLKKSVAFTELPVHNQHAALQTLFPLNSEADSNRPVNSERCAVDNNSQKVMETNDDSFSTTLDVAPVNKNGFKPTILHTIINNEVTALDCFSKWSDFSEESPIAVKYSLKNLKTECGISSYGHMLFAPKQQKSWQVLKKHCIAYKVEKGEAVVRMQGKKIIVGAGDVFYIPRGVEYAIANNKPEPLLLFFHKNTQ